MLRIPGALWRRLGLAALVIAGLGGAALVSHWGTRRAPPRQPVFVSTAEIGLPGSAIPERVIVVHTGSDWPVIVAAGIAAMTTVIAPALVIFREEYRQRQQRERERRKLRVWWAVRDLRERRLSGIGEARQDCSGNEALAAGGRGAPLRDDAGRHASQGRDGRRREFFGP